jgi:hypothetical protein
MVDGSNWERIESEPSDAACQPPPRCAATGKELKDTVFSPLIEPLLSRSSNWERIESCQQMNQVRCCSPHRPLAATGKELKGSKGIYAGRSGRNREATGKELEECYGGFRCSEGLVYQREELELIAA